MHARQFQRTLPGLGAGVGEEHAVKAGVFGEAQSKLCLAAVIEKVRGVDERAALAGDGLFNDRMAVAERIDADAAEQIKVLRTVLVDNVNAFAADKENGIALVGGQQQPGFGGANLIEFVQFIFLLVHQATITSVPWATRELHRSGREPAASAGKILTRLTPFKRASRQALSLGSMPPEMTSLLAISAI